MVLRIENLKLPVAKVAAPMRREGASGTQVVGGYVVAIDDNSDLLGRQRYKTFSEAILNTSVVAAGVRLFLNLVAKAEWKFEPADDSPEALEVAETLEEILGSMATPWHRVVRRSAMYRFYGFSIQEWVANRREDGTIGFEDIEPRAQITIERWDVDPMSGKVLGAYQRSPQSFQELFLPREKIVYVVDDSLNDSPEGLGLLRHIIEAVRKLKRLEQLEGYGFETDLRGVPIGRAPLGDLAALKKAGKITEAQLQDAYNSLKNFITSHIKSPQLGMVLESATYATTDERGTPSSVRKWDLDLLKSGSTSLGELAGAIQRLNREIARVLGIEHLMLGESGSGSGSFALSRDKSQTFALIVDSTLKELADVFEKDVLVPLMQLNGWDLSLLPTFKPEKIQHRELQELTAAIADLAQAGVTFDRTDEAVQEILDLAGLSRLDTMDIDEDAALLPTREKTKPNPDEIPERPEEGVEE